MMKRKKKGKESRKIISYSHFFLLILISEATNKNVSLSLKVILQKTWPETSVLSIILMMKPWKNYR
mgnify:CR=1 FL=1